MKVENDTVTLDMGDPLDRTLAKAVLDHLEGLRSPPLQPETTELAVALAKANGEVRVYARPPGSDTIYHCFVCGAASSPPIMANICLMCDSQPEAEIVRDLLSGSRIDYYHGDPKRPQVKAGTCDVHRGGLNALYLATAQGGTINKWLVDRCKEVARMNNEEETA